VVRHLHEQLPLFTGQGPAEHVTPDRNQRFLRARIVRLRLAGRRAPYKFAATRHVEDLLGDPARDRVELLETSRRNRRLGRARRNQLVQWPIDRFEAARDHDVGAEDVCDGAAILRLGEAAHPHDLRPRARRLRAAAVPQQQRQADQCELRVCSDDACSVRNH